MSEKTINKVPNVPTLRFKNYVYSWELKRLNNIAKIVSGGTPETEKNEYWNGDILWFTPSEVGHTKFVDNSERKITQLGLEKSNAKLLPIGTILLSTRATVGEVSISTKECTTNQGFQSVIVNKTNNLNFIYYLLQTLKRHFIKYACGSTFLEISNKEVAKTKIYIPSYIEQTKIGGFLSLIDERIDTQSKIISAIESQIFSINHLMISKNTETIKLGELCKFEPKTNRKSGDGLESGKYPFFTNEENQTQYLDTYDFDGEYIIANTGGKANFKYYKGKFAAMSDCLILKINSTDLTTFYSNVLRGKQAYINHVGFEGSGLKHLNKDWLLNMQVPTYNKSIRKYLLAIEMLKEKLQKEKDILSLYKKQKAYLLQNMFI